MEDKTLEAIRGSVKKWSLIVHMNGKDRGNSNCPLCQLFWNYWCHECPIVSSTRGRDGCRETPYNEWTNHQKNKHNDYKSKKIHCPECRRLAQSELMFLQSLLEQHKMSKNS